MKLELKHLAPYLPYGLKWSLQELSTFVMSGITNKTLYTESGTVLTWTKHPDLPIALFPLLRPLSSLTKKIEIDGKKFIPAKEIKRKFKKILFCGLGKPEIIWIENGYIRCYDFSTSILIFQQLIEWHFDVFGLIDEGLALPLI